MRPENACLMTKKSYDRPLTRVGQIPAPVVDSRNSSVHPRSPNHNINRPKALSTRPLVPLEPPGPIRKAQAQPHQMRERRTKTGGKWRVTQTVPTYCLLCEVPQPEVQKHHTGGKGRRTEASRFPPVETHLSTVCGCQCKPSAPGGI